MMNPTPQEVNTIPLFRGVCRGLPQPHRKEATVRVFCLTAKKHNTWFLTQEQLDGSGLFHWNEMIEEGWFEIAVNNEKINPTDIFFGRLLANGLIESDADEGDDSEEDKDTLILFKVRVVYGNGDKRNSYFTMLDISPDAASERILNRVNKYRNVLIQRGPIIKVEVTELEGPFIAGQIIAEER